MKINIHRVDILSVREMREDKGPESPVGMRSESKAVSKWKGHRNSNSEESKKVPKEKGSHVKRKVSADTACSFLYSMAREVGVEQRAWRGRKGLASHRKDFFLYVSRSGHEIY